MGSITLRKRLKKLDFKPGHSIYEDIRQRVPYYKSDWRDAWHYRILPASLNIYFANLLPELAFALDMFSKTENSFGVNEVLLASVLGSVVFSLLSSQPLCIVGVTGPITVFNYTIYNIIHDRNTPYFPFLCWICLWSAVFHCIIALTNLVHFVKYITKFSCEIFGLYVAFIYLEKGVQVLTDQLQHGLANTFLAITIALLFLIIGWACNCIGSSSLFNHRVRVFLLDYGLVASIIFFSGFQHIGKMRQIDLSKLPTSKAFLPTQDRSWFIKFWQISVGDVFLAIPFAIILTILFYFDHNVSSLMAQDPSFPLKKPSGFHWDFFLLGITTGVSGILGIPAPNGLIPQAPMHTATLCVTKIEKDDEEKQAWKIKVVIERVIEQRVSNFLQGLMTLGTMTGPLLVVLHQIPQCVLAGLFWVMGLSAIAGNNIARNIFYIFGDRRVLSQGHVLNHCRSRKAVWLYTCLQLLGFGATFAITQIDKASIGFPIVILLLIPFRTYLMPRWFYEEDLEILDENVGLSAYREGAF
ncbi:plasma membrane borate efflux transmembrane transporter Bor1 [Schizosaccharomyces osmophilus]|uniref:Plasma membrane borate efflux transmembrane transporter Bor1 n=1 Tax=Schizosaccharomyces osmophilus TaxID=2545709 RepID=A0AAE9WCQ6_9SCHI|nr:plasma membrane borate efflux transmembrane transporter Bor1 [Schizosaccharomyces osmophilus]WBW73946.1 plasma membrane borate efflux transmembrane transporter Bor1 [Schizosaccharomyces osmophilus]